MAVPPAGLPVVETFHSLQGEGVHAGRSAFFIRLAGCSVGCSWCDTKHSWPVEAHPHRRLQDLAVDTAAAAASGAAFVVITGGEPLHHNLDPLCAALRRGRSTGASSWPLPLHLETSGVDPLSGRFEWITLSPKRHRPATAELLAACHELKVVIHESADLAFAEAMADAALAARPAVSEVPQLLLQPAWGSAAGQELAIQHVRRNPAWRLSLQSHKWLGLR
ncbi:7-carboxy-7-deazaguanine synthase QueE [Synechococcus sp. J7-Johnson]|uniref:7-carboxy-7-deazaguanine synthase QueE n=1 Tax=Synechococcus sp. J7-Johnson TaxID=2823737 RepID=UPI0020CC316D|nr:7-carboxy-7-deazaguanine synthase QueE [Synechococcus sp. J7-Johnson]